MSRDTVELLKECSSGVKMGIASIDGVIDYVKDTKLQNVLSSYKDKHIKIENKARELLLQHGCQAENPPLMVKGMAWTKTNVKLTMDSSDSTCADLITDGCNMGIKSLTKYLNQYESAESSAKTLVQSLIKLEEDLLDEMKAYL